MKLVATKGSTAITFTGFSIAASNDATNKVARWMCSKDDKSAIEEASADQYTNTSPTALPTKLDASGVVTVACKNDATAGTLTMTAEAKPADDKYFDNKKWNSDLAWAAFATSGGTGINHKTGTFKWVAEAGATTLIATAATLYAASTMTF